MIQSFASLFLAAAMSLAAAQPGGSAKCVGGTLAALPSGMGGTILTADPDAFVFVTRSSTLRIPYRKIDAIEYGQEVNRRILLAFAVSPLFLLTKARAHYVTLDFTDEAGSHQTIVLRVDKHLIRSELATLETKTGHSIEYQDAEARKFRHS